MSAGGRPEMELLRITRPGKNAAELRPLVDGINEIFTALIRLRERVEALEAKSAEGAEKGSVTLNH